MRIARTTDEAAAVMRQAVAGMVWSQQFYHYDVSRWLDGDPAQPPPPAARKTLRNANWRHLNNHDIIAMPDDPVADINNVMMVDFVMKDGVVYRKPDTV